MSAEVRSLRLSTIRYEAESIASFEFTDPDGGALPGFAPGAHVDVHLPNGLVRSYSLSNDSSEVHRYVVTVARDAHSRGGSSYAHDALRVGQLLRVGMPANHFALNEGIADTVLIAGGVGITPIWCMAQRLRRLGRGFKLFYATRSRRNAAFLRELQDLAAQLNGRIHLHFDDESGLLDVARVVSENADARTHLYCCGPLPMLQSFEAACAHLPPEQVHVEYFKAKEAPVSADGVELVLAKSSRTIRVAPGKTVLDTVLEAGIEIPYSCMEGICGSCEVAVLDGIPDHHDSVLSDQQRASNRTMLICCSGARSARLVLDL
jgi:vanillate O-demethylase ferredoxin subunit